MNGQLNLQHVQALQTETDNLFHNVTSHMGFIKWVLYPGQDFIGRFVRSNMIFTKCDFLDPKRRSDAN